MLLSHNGMDVDLKLASRVTGLDAILGGHTHDGVPQPTVVANRSGRTLVTNAGSNSKFLGVLDFEVKGGKVADFRYRLLPVFANFLPADRAMAAYIEKMRAPYAAKLEEKLAVAGELLYRRGNFNGTFDQVILDALMTEKNAEIAFSPGFRWGTSGAARAGDHDGARARPDGDHVSVHDGERHLRRDAEDDPRGRRRQPLQPRSLLPAGRGHGSRRRPALRDRPQCGAGQAHRADDARGQGDRAREDLQGRGLGAGVGGSARRQAASRCGTSSRATCARSAPSSRVRSTCPSCRAWPAIPASPEPRSRHATPHPTSRRNDEVSRHRIRDDAARGRARRACNARAEAPRELPVAHHRRRAAGGSGSARALRQGRLHHGRRGRRPRRPRARPAAQRPRRRAHGEHGDGQGVDRAVVPHGHDRTRCVDAAGTRVERYSRSAWRASPSAAA